MTTIRPMKLPQDLDLWMEITREGFTYPDHPEWSIQADEAEGTMDSLRSLKRMWPIFAVLRVLSADVRDTICGFFYEADGAAAGNISYQRRRGGSEWYISDVVVLPQHRGKGIARKLVDATVDAIRARGGTKAFLDVIDGNTPAYNLYQKAGFEDFAGGVDFSFEGAPPSVTVPDGYSITALDETDWQTRYSFEKRITPDTVSKYTPVSEGSFRRSGLTRAIFGVLRKVLGEAYAYFAVRDAAGQVVGIASYEAKLRESGVNKIFVQIDPAHPAIASVLISQVIAAVRDDSHGQRVEFTLPTWQPALIEAAEKLGAQKRYVMHRMGMML
jgi:ribosomal protein S18 acetylase RimI-like enzyme